MKEFIEKLIGRLEEQKTIYREIRKNTYCRRTEMDDCDSCRADHYLDARLEGINKAKAIVNELAEEYKEEPWVDYETVRSNRVDCEVPSDYFEQIKEVWVIDEWTEETKVFKEAEEQNGGWIPCDENLPNHNQTVIFQTEDGMVETGYYDVNEDWCVNDSYFPNAFRFIAWQPLPEPYKLKGE